jgi:hypothetical protein
MWPFIHFILGDYKPEDLKTANGRYVNYWVAGAVAQVLSWSIPIIYMNQNITLYFLNTGKYCVPIQKKRKKN